MKKLLSFILASCLFLVGCTSNLGSLSSDSKASLLQYNQTTVEKSKDAPSAIINKQADIKPEVSSQTSNSSQKVNIYESTSSSAKTNSLSNDNYYTNVDGNQVHSPAYSSSVPSGASALCRDGTYSFSKHRSGTCSHHGGVAQWL